MSNKHSRQTFSEWLALTEAGTNPPKITWKKTK